MAYGVQSTGFVTKSLAIIRSEINTAAELIFGASIDTSDEDPMGQFIALFAEREALLWELAEAAYNGQNPDTNTGAAQDAIAAITGTVRKNAISSTVTAVLTGTAATVVDADSLASVASAESQFKVLADATIAAITAWAGTTAYVLGDRVKNDTPDRIYQCVQAGTSDGSGGPTGTGESIVDNTVEWDYLGDGDGAVDAACASAETGPIVALARTLTVIDTPVAGWSGVNNVLDAVLGRDIETNETMRVRRETELAAAGSGPPDAIRTDLLAVEDVTAVTIFNNNSNVTDADGVPPHSFEALVQGGEDQDIWDKLFTSGAGAGIESHGDEVGTSTDSQGNLHTMGFSRPTPITIHTEVTLTYDASLYPGDGDTQIKAAIVAMGDAQPTGKDAVSSRIKAACFTVAGVLDVSTAYIRTSDPPIAETTIAISTREIVDFDTSNVDVISSAATP